MLGDVAPGGRVQQLRKLEKKMEKKRVFRFFQVLTGKGFGGSRVLVERVIPARGSFRDFVTR
jgi:hypothetical protein